MKDRRRISFLRPSSAPPSGTPIEANWDDETLPGLAVEDPSNEFERVTVVPELPADLYAQQIMESAESSQKPEGEYFDFSTSPPPPPRTGPDSAVPGATSLPHSSHTAPTARPLYRPMSPGLPSLSPLPTSFELADLTFDSITTIKAAPHLELPRGPDLQDLTDPAVDLARHDEERNEERNEEHDDAEPVDPSALVVQHETTPLGEMKDRYAMGDFSGALVIAEGILELYPDDPEAPRYAQSCRDVLTQMYSARLGSLDQVVTVAVPSDQIRWLTLDHRAGFLLSLIDGGSTLDQILDISGMTRLDALRIMYQLLDQRVISLG